MLVEAFSVTPQVRGALTVFYATRDSHAQQTHSFVVFHAARSGAVDHLGWQLHRRVGFKWIPDRSWISVGRFYLLRGRLWGIPDSG